MKDYAVRDSWIFNRLTELIKQNVIQLAKHHCTDARLRHTHWIKMATNNRLNNLNPFSMTRNSDQFFLPMGEHLYVYRCKRKIVKPINLRTKK